MVIVEYCKHGNLSSYLKSKRGEYSPFKVNSIINLVQTSKIRLWCGFEDLMSSDCVRLIRVPYVRHWATANCKAFKCWGWRCYELYLICWSDNNGNWSTRVVFLRSECHGCRAGVRCSRKRICMRGIWVWEPATRLDICTGTAMCTRMGEQTSTTSCRMNKVQYYSLYCIWMAHLIQLWKPNQTVSNV